MAELKGCAVTIIDSRTCCPAFDMVVYGVSASELASVAILGRFAWEMQQSYPTVGSGVIRRALERRGLNSNDYQPLLFSIKELTAGDYR